MAICGFVGAIVPDADVAAIGTIATRDLNDSASARIDWRAAWGSEINPAVHFGVAEDGVSAAPITGTDARAVNGGQGQRLAGALPFGSVIISVALHRFVFVQADGFAAQFYFGDKNFPRAELFPVLIRELFIHDGELVAGLNVALKVDVKAEDLDQFRQYWGRHLRATASEIEAGVNRTLPARI